MGCGAESGRDEVREITAARLLRVLWVTVTSQVFPLTDSLLKDQSPRIHFKKITLVGGLRQSTDWQRYKERDSQQATVDPQARDNSEWVIVTVVELLTRVQVRNLNNFEGRLD